MRKILYIVRGLPGSGKTTLARMLAPNHHHAADDLFTDKDGNYNFDPTKLGDAHMECQSWVKSAMEAGQSPVAVHNTFSMQWEADFYIQKAHELGYSIFVVECQNQFENTHEVPVEGILNMSRRWQPLNTAKPRS